VRTFPLGTEGAKVDVWYPTTDDAVAGKAPAGYRLSDWLPPALQARVASDVDGYLTTAYRDVAPSAEGPFPLVLFSHGFSSYRDQSTFLTTHLASWGMVVASPDHLSRGLLTILSGGTSDPNAPAADMRATVALLRDTVTAPGAPLENTVDYERVATAGHSAGSGTAIRSAGDPELGVDVDTYVAMSAGDSARTSARTPLPDLPAVFMAGSVDATIAASETQRLYERAPTPKRFYEYAESGHLVFTDICEIGKDEGGVLALASSFGIEVPERLQRLASDGCQATAIPPPEVWPAIAHFTVANLRAIWGVDDPPIGLDAVDAFGRVEITTESSDSSDSSDSADSSD
jgi:predicted dienelactone hydrolase